jgi:hypothetical protein
MIDREDARNVAEGILDVHVRPGIDEEVVISDDQVRETESVWIFSYNTRSYLEMGLMNHALAGNLPILVEKLSGSAYFEPPDI